VCAAPRSPPPHGDFHRAGERDREWASAQAGRMAASWPCVRPSEWLRCWGRAPARAVAAAAPPPVGAPPLQRPQRDRNGSGGLDGLRKASHVVMFAGRESDRARRFVPGLSDTDRHGICEANDL